MLTDQILDTLKAEDRLTDAQLAELRDVASRGERVEQILLNRKLITEDELLTIRGKLLGLPIATLVGKEIPPAVLNTLPRNLADRYGAVVFEREGDRITVGIVDPSDQSVVEAIEFFAREQQLSAHYAVISPVSYRAAMRQYEENKRETEQAISEATERLAKEESGEAKGDGRVDIVSDIERAPVSQIVATIIRHALEANASDIHIEPFGKHTRVRYRVDGVLKTTLSLPASLHSTIISRVKVLAKLRLDETRLPQDGRVHISDVGREVDLRISTLPLLENEKVVMRILETSAKLISLEDLGFRPWHIEIIDRSVHRPNGMVLLTGPTGSGKSTTLYAVLNLLNDEGVNITTLEDPIEYYVRGVNQAQIRPEVDFTFATGLRAILRQDPNVIMVGEIRDTETAELAIHAGLTGHLLFSTLHTRDVLGVVPRLIDMKIEPFLLASTLVMAEGQRLVRKVCPDCKEAFTPAGHVIADIERQRAAIPDRAIPDAVRGEVRLVHGRGCARCGGTGYRGRTVAVEILEFGNELQQLIVQGFPDQEVRAFTKEQGMVSIVQDALLKALEGETTYEEVLRISHE